MIYSCIKVEHRELVLLYDKGIALDVSEISDEEKEKLKRELTDGNDRCNVFEREKIFGSKYYGNSLCIIPSNVCQMECKYCYSFSGGANSDRYIDIVTIMKCIDVVFQNSKLYRRVPNARISFLFHGGGEPTQNWSLFQNIVEYIIHKKDNTGSKVFLKLVTNGIMSSEKAKWISLFFDEIVVSIDGPEYINNQIRVLKNQEDSTNIAIASANIFGEKRKVGIHSVVTSLSEGKAIEIIDYFRTNICNINFISFQRCRNTDNGRNNALMLDAVAFMEFVKAAYFYAPDLVRTSMADLTVKESFCKGCAGNILYCFPNGNISMCNEHDVGIYKIGTYHDGIMIKPELYLDYKRSVMQKIKRLQCKQCYAFPFCRGGCHSYYLQCSTYEEEWCSIYKMFIVELLKEKMCHSEKFYTCYNGKSLSYFYYYGGCYETDEV